MRILYPLVGFKGRRQGKGKGGTDRDYEQAEY